ncbi:MAG TPA: nickel-binding protein [Polyangiaceae bacterium]|jgi:hypothetical protein|nr:nickel-binding protein [Polyangiaceae bacterium]
MPVLIVEYEFNPPITEEGLAQMGAKLAACEGIRQIRRLRTVLAADGRRGFCELEAPDAETVREAFRSAHIPFRSVWPARLYDGLPPSER